MAPTSMSGARESPVDAVVLPSPDPQQHTSVAQRILITLKLSLEGIIGEASIARKCAQLGLRASRLGTEELDKKLKDAHVRGRGGIHPPTLRPNVRVLRDGSPPGVRTAVPRRDLT